MKNGMDDMSYEIQHAIDNKISSHFAYEAEISELEIALRSRTFVLSAICLGLLIFLISIIVVSSRNVSSAYDAGYEAGYDDGINDNYHHSYLDE